MERLPDGTIKHAQGHEPNHFIHILQTASHRFHDNISLLRNIIFAASDLDAYIIPNDLSIIPSTELDNWWEFMRNIIKNWMDYDTPTPEFPLPLSLFFSDMMNDDNRQAFRTFAHDIKTCINIGDTALQTHLFDKHIDKIEPSTAKLLATFVAQVKASRRSWNRPRPTSDKT